MLSRCDAWNNFSREFCSIQGKLNFFIHKKYIERELTQFLYIIPWFHFHFISYTILYTCCCCFLYFSLVFPNYLHTHMKLLNKEIIVFYFWVFFYQCVSVKQHLLLEKNIEYDESWTFYRWGVFLNNIYG